MTKEEYLKNELDYIEDEHIKKDALYLINKLPDYFFEVPASSTGKYHPAFSNTEHGLLKHTKAAVRIAKDLMENNTIGYKFTKKEQDLIILALILHDGIKYGQPKDRYTSFDHPLIMSKFVMENKRKLSLDVDDLRFLCGLIESHMGEWTKHPKTGEEVLPKPTTKACKFVHLCDFLSSKKYLNIEFEGINIKE